MGHTLVFSSPVLQCCLNYICFAHNNFTTVQQSSRTPRDLVIGDTAKNHAFALFGCKVLAEVPESIIAKNPNLPRFVEGVFLHPEFSSMGVWVSARIRIGSEMVIQRFVAKSIKLCMPVEILDGHGLFVKLVDERSGLVTRGSKVFRRGFCSIASRLEMSCNWTTCEVVRRTWGIVEMFCL